MNAQMQKQILLGGLAGLFVAALSYFLLGGKRDELKETNNQIDVLKKDVDKGWQLKANAEKFQQQAEELQKRIDELVKLMPTEDDRGEIPYQMKKLADTAGIDQSAFSLEQPNKKDYYTEYPVKYTYRVGFHTFGHFASLVSGYGKMINLHDVQIKRIAAGKGMFPAEAVCKVTAFVYNPGAPELPPPEDPKAKKKPSAPKRTAGGED